TIHPFPGLRAFEEEEEHLFFGREKAVTELLSRLRASRFLAVIGTSGSGKSSLVKSGLLPALYRGFMAGAGSHWRTALLRPGDNPIGNLARVLTNAGIFRKHDEKNGDDENDDSIYGRLVETTLRRSNQGLVDVVKQSHLQAHENLLVVVDQFEELFRFSKLEQGKQDGKRDSTAFIKLLLETAGQTRFPIYILLTMRSDFLGDCTQFRGLPEAINDGQYLIPRMTRGEKRAAVKGPIAVGGGEIAPTLISRLLNDVGESPDHLPILQHALMRTWDYWLQHRKEGEPLGLEHYQAVGTMERALSEHAEEAHAELKSEKSRTICEKMFKLLTDRGETGRGVRRPAKVSEICAVTNASEKDVIHIINGFRKPGRTFLMPPPEIELDGESVVDISHESLMRIWTRLIDWVKEEEQSAELYLRLAQDAALHEAGQKGLWRDPELQLALNWREKNKPNALWARRYDPSFDRAIDFLEAGKKQQIAEIAEKEKAQKTKTRLRRIFMTVIIAGLIVTTAFAFLALSEKKAADEARDKAETAAKAAEVAQKAEEKQKEKANENAEKAALAKEEAVKARVDAEIARDDAKKNETKARVAETAAIKNETRANKNAVKAEIKGLIVDMNKEDAHFRQRLAKAKELAVHSVSIAQTDDKKLKAALALTAYQMNRTSYEELALKTNAIYEKFDKNTAARFHDKKEITEANKKLKKTHETEQAKARNRHQPAIIFEALREAYISREGSPDIIYDNAESWALAAPGNNRLVFNNRGGQLFITPFHLLPGADAGLWDKTKPLSLSTNFLLPASCFAESRDRFFCGTQDGRVVSWQKNNWKELKQLAVHSAKILSAAFSKNKNCLFYSVGNTVYRVDLSGRGEPAAVIEEDKDNYIRAFTLVEDTRFSILIAGDKNGNLFQYDLSGDKSEKKELYKALKPGAYHATAYNPARKLLILADSRGELHLFTHIDARYLASDGEIQHYKMDKGHKGVVKALAFSRGGRYLASGGLDGTVMLWDLKGKKDREAARQNPVLTVNGKSKILSIAFEPKGEYMIFCDEKRLRICPTSPGIFYEKLCGTKTRDLSDNEWDHYIGGSVRRKDITICSSREGKK
ncbi:MAG: AAA family ATPase, partial [bacterium]|nr:AAA family ATPase [bacterium]